MRADAQPVTMIPSNPAGSRQRHGTRTSMSSRCGGRIMTHGMDYVTVSVKVTARDHIVSGKVRFSTMSIGEKKKSPMIWRRSRSIDQLAQVVGPAELHLRGHQNPPDVKKIRVITKV